MEFKPAQHSPQAAWGIILAGIGVAALGATVLDLIGVSHEWVLSIRLFALMTLVGPLVWLLLNLAQQRTGLTLYDQGLVIRYPLPLFDRQIEYPQIALSAMINTEQIAIIWLKPRRTAPGEEPLPPRPRLLISMALHQAQHCQQELNHRCLPHDNWTLDSVHKMAQHRRWLRRGLGCLGTPIISFVIILLIVRIATAFLRI